MQRSTNLNPVPALLCALKTAAQNSAVSPLQTQRMKNSMCNKSAAAGAGEQGQPLSSGKVNSQRKAVGASLTHSETDLVFFLWPARRCTWQMNLKRTQLKRRLLQQRHSWPYTGLATRFTPGSGTLQTGHHHPGFTSSGER